MKSQVAEQDRVPSIVINSIVLFYFAVAIRITRTLYFAVVNDPMAFSNRRLFFLMLYIFASVFFVDRIYEKNNWAKVVWLLLFSVVSCLDVYHSVRMWDSMWIASVSFLVEIMIMILGFRNINTLESKQWIKKM